MKQVIILAGLCLFAAPVAATVYVEDFEYPQPTVNSWTTDDGIFTHTMSDNAIWEMSGSPINQRMTLLQESHTITFNIPSGQYVDYVSFYYVLNDGWATDVLINTPETIHFISLGPHFEGPQPYFFETEMWGISGEIQSMTFRAVDEWSEEWDLGLAYDDITINVVPEPATLALLAVGTLMLRKRKP